MRRKFFILAKKTLLISVERDGGLFGGQATEQKTRQVFGQKYYQERDEILY